MSILKVPQVLPLDSALKGQQLNKATVLLESLLPFCWDFSLTSDQTGKQDHGVKKTKCEKKKKTQKNLLTSCDCSRSDSVC